MFLHKPLNPAERKRAVENAERGRLTNEFIKSDFWLKAYGPWLSDELDNCASKCLFNPGNHRGNPAEIALQVVFNSGMAAQVRRIQEELAIWIERGKEAQVDLERDNKILEAA